VRGVFCDGIFVAASYVSVGSPLGGTEADTLRGNQMTGGDGIGDSAVLTMNEAVRALTHVISKHLSDADIAAFTALDISPFVEEHSIDEFVHLCALMTQYAHASGRLIKNPESCVRLVQATDGTNWAIPLCVALLELRYADGTLGNLEVIEKKNLLKFYKLDSAINNISDFKLHCKGTTSIIFRYENSAIKIIRPVYIVDDEIASLNAYKDKYENYINIPAMGFCSGRALIMRFFEGATLFDFIHKVEEIDASIDERIKIALNIVKALCEIHRNGQTHGDLSSRNILIGLNSDIQFIDYGYNFSFKRPILDPKTLRQALRYIPREDDGELPTERSPYRDDIYAVAGIFVDLVMANDQEDHDALLDALYEKFPDDDFPFILEDCLSPKPQFRLARYAESGRDHLLALKFSRALDKSNAKDAANSSTVSEATGGILDNLREFIELFALLRKPIEASAATAWSEKQERLILFFRKFCQFSTGLTIALALGSLFGAFGLGDGAMEFEFGAIRRWWAGLGFSLTSADAGPYDVLPGHLICLSFLFLASRYYLSLFSRLQLPESGEFEIPKTRRVVWINSFAFCIPILYCFVLDPKSWPFCSAIGLFLVGYNNRSVRRSLTLIAKSSEFRSITTAKSLTTMNFKRIFSGWGMLVSWYAIGLILAGLVLATSTAARNPLFDRAFGNSASYDTYEYFTAVVAMGINYFKMQRENCGNLAPAIRTMIRRNFEAAESILSGLRSNGSLVG
jgi:serine/threonine protein kinase